MLLRSVICVSCLFVNVFVITMVITVYRISLVNN